MNKIFNNRNLWVWKVQAAVNACALFIYFFYSTTNTIFDLWVPTDILIFVALACYYVKNYWSSM